MPNSQKGFAHLFLVLLLLLSIPIGVYLANNPTFFKPKASELLISSNTGDPNVYVIEVDDSVDSPNGILIDDVVKKFYKDHPDKDVYDFMAIFPSFLPADGKNYQNSPPFGGQIQNQVRGICEPIKSIDPQLGSKRLMGTEYYPYNPSNYDYWINEHSESGNFLLEETSHRWLTQIGVNQTLPPGGIFQDGMNPSCLNSELQLTDSTDKGHWSKALQTDDGGFGAMRGARPWVDNKDGTYSYDPRLSTLPRKFHPFDLYLMGLMDKSEVTKQYLLLDKIVGNIDMGSPPNPLVIVKAEPIKVTIQDVINIAGEERSPKAINAQKDFNLAFVIFTKKGVSPSPTLITAIKTVAQHFPAQWAYATGNRSTINKDTQIDGPTAGSPTVSCLNGKNSVSFPWTGTPAYWLNIYNTDRSVFLANKDIGVNSSPVVIPPAYDSNFSFAPGTTYAWNIWWGGTNFSWGTNFTTLSCAPTVTPTPTPTPTPSINPIPSPRTGVVPAVTNVVATAQSCVTRPSARTPIKISWTNPNGAQWHKIERTTNGTAWGVVGYTDGKQALVSQYLDYSSAGSTWYAYRVSVAVFGYNTLSAVTNSNWIKSLSCP